MVSLQGKRSVTLREIAEILEAEVITDSNDLDISIESACSADMMSAVLYYHTPNSLLITGLTQPHVITTAEIAGIKTIAFVMNKRPDESTINLALKKRIPILITPLCMYSASGRLYSAGLPGCLNK